MKDCTSRSVFDTCREMNQADIIIQRFLVKVWMNSSSVLVNSRQESIFRQVQTKVKHLKRRSLAALSRCKDESLADKNSTAHASVDADHERPFRPVIDD